MASPLDKQGYLGDLSTKSTAELEDLLTRQKKILSKTKFVDSLPDKGAKVRAFAEKLQRLISERQLASDSNNQNISTKIRTDVVSRYHSEAHAHNRKQQLDRLRDTTVCDSQNMSEKRLENINNTEISNTGEISEEQVKSMDLSVCNAEKHKLESQGYLPSFAPDDNDDLEESLQTMHISEDSSKTEILPKSGEHSSITERIKMERSTNAYTKAIQNASSVQIPFKPNSALKITKVADLPSKYKYRSLKQGETTQNASLIEEINKPVEESAATPPVYTHQNIQLISLAESLEIQNQQKIRQEELHAKYAAEKLAQRLCVTMDSYNPEGVDMSYRVQEEVDSDDEVD